MNCDQTRELFSLHLDERLPAIEKARLEGHLESCDGCRVANDEYREVFAMLRLLPTCQTDATAPIPEAARSFFNQTREMSAARKALAVALIFVSAGMAAYFGYSLGIEDGPGTPDSAGEITQVNAGPIDNSTPVMLSKPAGRRLRRAHDGLSNLAWFANEAPSIADASRAVETFGDVLNHSPLVDDVTALRSLDHNSLGTWQSDVYRFCDETIEAVNDVRSALSLLNETPATRLVRARQVMLERDAAAESLLKLAKVARCFDALPWRSPAELGVVNEHHQHAVGGFSEALLSVMSGQSRRGVIMLDQFQRAHPNSPLHLSAQLLLQRLQSSRAQGVPFLQRHSQSPNGTWSAIIDNRSTNKRIRIVIRGAGSSPRSRKL